MLNKRSTHQKKKKRGLPHRARPEGTSSEPLARHAIFGVCISLLIALALLLILALITYLTKDPSSLIHPLGLSVSAVTALTCGFATVRLHGKNALLCGLASGCILMAIMLPLSLFFKGASSAYSPLLTCLLHAAVPILSVLGGFAALPRTGAARAHRSKRR